MYLLLQTTFQPQIKLKFLLCHVVLIIHPAYLQIKHTNSSAGILWLSDAAQIRIKYELNLF